MHGSLRRGELLLQYGGEVLLQYGGDIRLGKNSKDMTMGTMGVGLVFLKQNSRVKAVQENIVLVRSLFLYPIKLFTSSLTSRPSYHATSEY